MSNTCVPIAIYLDKMLNNLQTRPSTFVHIPESIFFKGSCPMGLGFLGAQVQKPKQVLLKTILTGQKEPCCSGTSSDFYRWKPAREGTQLVADSAKLLTPTTNRLALVTACFGRVKHPFVILFQPFIFHKLLHFIHYIFFFKKRKLLLSSKKDLWGLVLH